MLLRTQVAAARLDIVFPALTGYNMDRLHLIAVAALCGPY